MTRSASQRGFERVPLAGLAAKYPVIKFVGLAAVLVLLFWALTSIPYVRSTLHPAFLDAIADSSAWLLRRFGENARADEALVSSPRFTLSIARGCDAIDPIGLYAAALIAFPARWRVKVTGLVLGAAALFMLNYVRIISLYYVGADYPDIFETMHVDVWQSLFVFATLSLWIGWAWWATGKRGKQAASSEKGHRAKRNDAIPSI